MKRSIRKRISKKQMKGGGFFSWLKSLFTRKRPTTHVVEREDGWFYAGGSKRQRNNKTRKLRRK